MRKAHEKNFHIPPSRRLFEPLGDPELDERLPGHAEPVGLPVERLNDPGGEIDVDAARLQAGTAGAIPVDVSAHVLALVERLIEVFGFDNRRFRLGALGGRR